MGRKKKKKKTEGQPNEGAGAASDTGEKLEVRVKIPRGEPWSEPSKAALNFLFGPKSDEELGLVDDEEGEEEAARPAPGFFSRLLSWFGGGSQPAVRAPGRAEASSSATQSIEQAEAEPVAEATPPETASGQVETVPVPAEPTDEHPSEQQVVEHLREQLQQKERHLESLREQRNELHQQLRAAEQRTKELETLLQDSRSESQAVTAAQKDQQVHEMESLQADKEAAEARVHSLEAAVAEQTQRAQALEKELKEQDKPLEELRQKVDELSEQLRAKDEALAAARSGSSEAEQARQEAKRALTQVRDLESALQQAEENARGVQAELAAQRRQLEELQDEAGKREAADAEAAETPEAAPEKMAALYREAITPLTVLVASADLLLMDARLEASLRETASDIKTESQKLLDLVKKHAGEPAADQSS